MNPLTYLLVCFGGWMNRQQQAVIEYLQEEVRVLQEQLGILSEIGTRFISSGFAMAEVSWQTTSKGGGVGKITPVPEDPGSRLGGDGSTSSIRSLNLLVSLDDLRKDLRKDALQVVLYLHKVPDKGTLDSENDLRKDFRNS